MNATARIWDYSTQQLARIAASDRIDAPNARTELARRNAVASAPDPATRATDAADLPSSPVCPLHGASCEAWR